ncbi:MAG TPA: tetratricopeptide repeat protein, partial [Reyranellaceae bacterium]|nr:tetratricopeptide repeat protein [Reyranellaceae bacterium]
GLVLQALRRPAEALAACDRALALRPNFVEAANNRGNALRDLNRLAEAVAAYDHALRLRPDFALAHSNRANALAGLGRLAEALEGYDRALQLWPDFPDALNNRGRVLRDLKRFPEAAACFERLLAVQPATPFGPGMLLDTRLQACDWSGLAEQRTRIEAGIARGERADAPFSFLCHSTSAELQRRCAELFVADQHPPAPALSTGARYDHDRIRLCYLSGDFHQHATAYLMAELFETHDRARFEIVGVSFGPADGSAMRARLEKGFDRFIDMRATSDLEVARWLRDNEIDIAVDLKGFTAANRAGIFSHRGAPLQVAYLGFPGTMGAPFIDYLIADHHVVPPGHERFYSEKIVRLPDCYQVNDRRRSIDAKTPSRAALGLPESAFVFCSFNNNYKIRPDVFDVWMRLLGDTPQSVLWLLDDNEAAKANLRREAGQRGIAADRLLFAPRLPLEQHLARHRAADLFIDTFPVNAHTTASDALWAGLPVVTLQGETFVSRVAASLVQTIGLPELATDTLANYESTIRRLAGSPGQLKAVRERLVAARTTTPLFDTDRLRRHIEAAFIEMHRRQQEGLPADSFDVRA